MDGRNGSSVLLFHGVPLVRAQWRRESALDVAADALSADLFWFIGAGAHRTDRPYVTVVWDIQHRVTPWFPELSAKGMWDIRDLASERFLQRASKVVVGTAIGQAEIDRHYQIPAERTVLLPHPTPGFALDGSDRAVLPASLGYEPTPDIRSILPIKITSICCSLSSPAHRYDLMLDLALSAAKQRAVAQTLRASSRFDVIFMATIEPI